MKTKNTKTEKYPFRNFFLVLMAVNFVKSQKVSTVLSYEHYLLLWIFEKKSTEFSPICLLSNGMSCVQSNLYGEIKPNCLWVTAMVLFFLFTSHSFINNDYKVIHSYNNCFLIVNKLFYSHSNKQIAHNAK